MSPEIDEGQEAHKLCISIKSSSRSGVALRELRSTDPMKRTDRQLIRVLPDLCNTKYTHTHTHELRSRRLISVAQQKNQSLLINFLDLSQFTDSIAHFLKSISEKS